ncbi:MAG: HAD-IIA family hydrolase [Tannerella sp.]|jgi:NagD protein|nr:HAD-IIA family hydrolase [Tannerella sp.]
MTYINDITQLDHNPALSEKLRRIRHVALDMDGTIYKGNTLFTWTKTFLDNLADAGITYSFLTNNPSKNKADYIAHLAGMGLTITANDLVTSADATVEYLKRQRPDLCRLFILGTPSMIAGFEAIGYVSLPDDPCEEPDAVLVGFDMTLQYSRLCRAAWWIAQGKPYFATNPDFVCPTDRQTVLVDCGSICAALERATGRKPDKVFGKPDPSILDAIINANNLKPGELALVGDRIYTDMLTAVRAKTFSALTLSGEATRDDAEKSDLDIDIVVENIGVLGQLIVAARG